MRGHVRLSALFGLLFATACGGPATTLNFTFVGSADCDGSGVDDVIYRVDAGAQSPSGDTPCGTPATFSLPPGSYDVTADGMREGTPVYSGGGVIQITAGSNDFTINLLMTPQ